MFVRLLHGSFQGMYLHADPDTKVHGEGQRSEGGRLFPIDCVTLSNSLEAHFCMCRARVHVAETQRNADDVPLFGTLATVTLWATPHL